MKEELSRSFPARIQSNPTHWNSYLQDESRHIAVSLYMWLDFKNWCPKVRGKPPSLQATLLSTDFLILFIGQILKCYSLALPFFSSVPLGNLLVIWSNRCQRFLHAELHNENLCRPTHPYGSYPPRSPLTSAEISWGKKSDSDCEYIMWQGELRIFFPSHLKKRAKFMSSFTAKDGRGAGARQTWHLPLAAFKSNLNGENFRATRQHWDNRIFTADGSVALPELRRLKMKFQWCKFQTLVDP